LKSVPFWDRENAGRSVIINVPMTYPAKEMNGVLIAGFVALDLERATYPRTLMPKLKELKYKVDVDSQKAHQSLGFFMRDLNKTLEARIAAYQHLWQEEAWDDTFMLVFTGTDRLAHFMWDAYRDETHPQHEAFLEHFQRIDDVIGEIAQAMEDDDILLMLSDHGFERLIKNVYVNRILQENGFLSYVEGRSPSLKVVSRKSKAFALDPGRIYVNIEGKYPRGTVSPADRDAVINEIAALFESLECEGKRVTKRVYRRDELYHGPFAERAPDLVLLGEQGYNLRGSWKVQEPFGTDLFTGKHSQADAFLLTYGQGAEAATPEAPTVFDVVGVMDAMRSS
jgi:predicted AlkP superfamily phosphohydrolase/phosphomutase